MKGVWSTLGLGLIVVLCIATGASAWFTSSQFSSSSFSSGCNWDPWYGTSCSQQQQYSSSSSFSSGYGPYEPPLYFGGYYSDYYSSWSRSSSWLFAANGSQIADVSGVWKTDLLGNITLKLTGDDIIRGMYTVNKTNGYIQGNFTYNTTPMMDGIWWE